MTTVHEKDDEARRCFIEAFKQLYPENGMRGLSASTLASRAGYSRSTLYRCFESVYDLLAAVEIEATPYKNMNYLVDNAATIDMTAITNYFLVSLAEREPLIRMFTLHSDDNRYYERLHDCIFPVFRGQAERVYLMETSEYDVLAEYITMAKLALLRLWTSSTDSMPLGHMTQITDSVFEGGMWARVEEAAEATRDGRLYERTPLSFFKQQYPWVMHRPLL